ncbi:MAG TPA: 4'-phosphopantetheinyl transferase [Mesorhizobium sp.]|jgi:4'-phosphopantetheinyl transferase EntD|uniref:4'-phosphopantetheinyl transferase family protein n=1 Tax=Mesorhizobium sp. TaxID=1871066 RepID=UPI002DDDB1C6|nr:4'-phosphopantetheinyl transferase [Mesorhizobium sp.]HEV2505950.1 4'-phosphopantetheinyl transferase [Mesorhizobium sp.]
MTARPVSQHAAGTLEQALAMLAPPGLLVGCRRIETGDASHILPGESATILSRAAAARDASGAGRWLARRLLRQLGYGDLAIPRGKAGEPLWPAGVVGSIAHDADFAIAVVAPSETMRGVGVDIEPALPLPPELEPLVLNSRDRLEGCDVAIAGKIAFAVKEAAYKASFPLDGEVLGFEDIAVDLPAGTVTLSNGRRVGVGMSISSHIFALAFVPAGVS